MYLFPFNKHFLFFTGLLVFICLNSMVWAQTVPPLGAASTFAILGGTTVTATGIDTISGNIGVSPGTAVTGFPPGVVENGAIYTGADTMVVKAKASAKIAYDNLVGQSYPAGNNLSDMILGVSPGAIHLVPGVYHFNAAAQLTDTLFLDDGGNANAVYIFQLGTTITTAAASAVIMASGGTGKNVYWQIGSSATFGAGTSFCGNLIAFTSVTMNPAAFTTGRVFALNAAVTVNGTTIQAVSKTWTGGAGTHNWGDAGNWNTVGVPSIKDNVDLTDADTIHVNVNAYTKNLLIDNKNLVVYIDSGQSLLIYKIFRLTIGKIINKANIILYSTIIDSAAQIASTGTITMQGNVAQTLPATIFSGNNTGNLTLNNGAGVVLGGTLNLYGNLLINTGQFTTGGHLTLASDADSTGSLDGSGSGTITGNLTMQRYLSSGFGYKYFSSPVTAATVGVFSTVVALSAKFPNFYSYLENTDTTGFVTDTLRTNPLIPMAGYAADFGSSTASKLVSISGTFNTGAVSIALTNTNQKYTQGFNLVGNPYPSPVNWNAAGWTKTNIDNAVYYFDTGSADQYSGSYSTYVNGVSSNGIADSVIASMQGFFVHVTNGAYPVSGTLGADNTVRVNVNAPYFHRAGLSVRKSGTPLIRFGARAHGSAKEDPVVVYVDSTSTTTFSKRLDAVKFMNTGAKVPNLYLVQAANEKLAIKALPGMELLGNIQLGLELKTSGIVDLSLIDLQQLPAELEVYLVDIENGTSQNLRQNPVYSIMLEKGTYDKRFQLRCISRKAFAYSGH